MVQPYNLQPATCHLPPAILTPKNKIMLIKRREFLKISSLATASMLMPNFLKAMTLDEALNPGQNILVVLQFTGGNDGLNTIIPAKNDIYFRERKTLAIHDSIPLTDEAGINPSLSYFKELFDNFQLKKEGTSLISLNLMTIISTIV